MRNINWDEPLSPEDRAWAEQRPDIPVKDGKKIADLLAEIDGREAPAKNREERRAELRTLIADSQNELARLDKEEADEINRNVALAGSVGDQEAGLIVRDHTAVNGERPEGAPGQVEQYTDEKYWTLNRLKDELRKRNSDRQSAGENPFPLTGNRSELVERLKRDDEELAAQEGE
jgi:hypothetical protein